jgi:hypothetical protein
MREVVERLAAVDDLGAEGVPGLVRHETDA